MSSYGENWSFYVFVGAPAEPRAPAGPPQGNFRDHAVPPAGPPQGPRRAPAAPRVPAEPHWRPDEEPRALAGPH